VATVKNLLTYISPERAFNAEHQVTAKVQIDNSLSLGWAPGDLLLVTNFPYEYNGVQARVIGDESFCRFCWPATKVYVIDYLFRAGEIEPDLYWYHDFDCFQLHPFTDPVIERADIGMTNYGRVPRLCSASVFFKDTAGDIFARLKAEVARSHVNEEECMARLLALDASLKDRFELLNVTYAMNRANIRPNYAAATKPLKAAHFHLTPDKYSQFVLGRTRLGIPIVPDRLVEVFAAHGWTG
jgi:hypothetical protein